MLYYFERAVFATWLGVSTWIEHLRQAPHILMASTSPLDQTPSELQEVRVASLAQKSDDDAV